VFFVLEIRKQKKSHKAFVSPLIGVEEFFKMLHAHDTNYVVMHWFEDLPATEPGRNLDLLVADEDLDLIYRLAEELPGTLELHVHSVSGLHGTDILDTAHFPPALADRILARAQWKKGCFRVPSEEDTFLGLAYHAVYHQGVDSGLPTSMGHRAPRQSPRHDYADVLRERAASLGIDVGISLEELDGYLEERGWRPPLDMLGRLARSNEWLEHRLARQSDWMAAEPRGLAVFLIRRKAVEYGLQDEILSAIEAQGFQILEHRLLTDREIREMSSQVRGGNREREPFPTSAGEPAIVVIAHDLIPVEPSVAVKERHPNLDNARLLTTAKIRDLANARLPSSESCNVIHSTDNRAEALAYLNHLMPNETEVVLDEVDRINKQFRTKAPVVRALTQNGRRAKVELIEFANRLAVKKTFRPGCERFLHRELLAYAHFSEERPEFVAVLDHGPDFLVLPYFDDTLRFRRDGPGLVPLKVAKNAIGVLRFLYEKGYAHLDFGFHNVVVDREEGMKIIDLEFLHRYDTRPASFEQSYDVVGPPKDFAGDLPSGRPVTYETALLPFTGLDLKTLLHAPAWLQHALRFRYCVTRKWPRYALRYPSKIKRFSKRLPRRVLGVPAFRRIVKTLTS
jgi:hypothetical protein